MPRKRYPSDETRLKRPSGVVIAYSIMTPDPDHPEQTQVFQDPEKRGIWTGLVVLAGAAFAGRTGDRVTLSDGHLTWCTGRTHRRHALSALRMVCEPMGYSISDRGHCVVVHVKNLSQNQGWTPQNSVESTRSYAELPPPYKSQSQSHNYPATPSPGATRESPEGETDTAKSRGRGRPPPERHPEASRLATLLCGELVANVKHWTPPGSLEAWTTEFDRMLRLDGPHRSGIPPNEIERVIRWVVRDDFESANVQSAGKLRKRFGQLAAKANTSKDIAKPKKHPERKTSGEEWLEEEARLRAELYPEQREEQPKAREPPESPAAVARQVSESLKQASKA